MKCYWLVWHLLNTQGSINTDSKCENANKLSMHIQLITTEACSDFAPQQMYGNKIVQKFTTKLAAVSEQKTET